MYGKSADKFLSLIPECCRLNPMHSTEQDEDGVLWGRSELKYKHACLFLLTWEQLRNVGHSDFHVSSVLYIV